MPEHKTERKTVLITGASAGIGKELAKEFATQGYQVYCGARRKDAMGDISETAGIHVFELDVTSDESVNALKQQLEEKLGGELGILYNNAGVSSSYPGLDTSIEDAKSLFDVNYFGAMRMNNAFGPMVIKAKGIIVHTGSVAADVCPPWGSTYNASKGALRAYVKSLQYELGPLGVQVTDVITGSVKTEMFGATPKPELSKDSLFHVAKVSLDAQRDPSQHEKMPAWEYAKNVVSQVVERKVTIYAGGQAKASYWLMNWSPGNMRGYIMDKVFKIPEYKKAVKESQK